MDDPAGKQAVATWVVVGASRGIGFEFVKQLLKAGHRVIGTVRNPSGAGELSRVIEAQDDPKNCIMEQCDVTSSESIDVSLSFLPLSHCLMGNNLLLQNFAAKITALMKTGIKLDGIIMNAGVLKYPNRATEL
jgi:NAD(P)-dependent dehydrogenase (short-subunit alcohol dehydrogenase family)